MLLDSSLPVILSIRQDMDDLDHRLNRHEAFLADAERQFHRDKRRLHNNLNTLLSVFADLQRRQDERFPKIPAVERYHKKSFGCG